MSNLCHTINVNIFTPKEVIRHFPHAVERTYSHGQIIVYYGDAPRHVMFIKSGAVKLYDTDSEGNEKIMHIGGEGSIFPLFYSFEDKISVDAFYASLTKTELLLVPITDFQRKLKTDAPYAFEVLRWYASELDHSMLRLKSMEKSNAKQKIAQALTYLCEQHADKIRLASPWYRIRFPLTQQTIADITGLTRETVNIALNEPAFEKCIRIKRQMFEVCLERVGEFLD